MANKISDLLAEAERLGYDVMGGGPRHHKAVHRETGNIVFFPSSPGGGRGFQNAVNQLKQGAGLSNRGREAMVGQRRDRPPRQRQPHHDRLDPDIERQIRAASRQRELDSISRLMKPGR